MLFWWVTAKSSACQWQGPYSYAKQGMEVGTGAGFQMREPIYPAALNSFNIFSILCILVSHLQLCIGSWAAFTESPFLLEGLEQSWGGQQPPALLSEGSRDRSRALAHRAKDGLSFPSLPLESRC